MGCSPASMDSQMPNMCGPEAIERIRKNGSDAFIIGVTGNMFPEDTQALLSSGANGVLPKPFKLDALESLWDEYNHNDK